MPSVSSPEEVSLQVQNRCRKPCAPSFRAQRAIVARCELDRREPGNGVRILHDSKKGLFYLPFPISFTLYRGSGVCATITPFLKSSTISGFRRISEIGRAHV